MQTHLNGGENKYCSTRPLVTSQPSAAAGCDILRPVPFHAGPCRQPPTVEISRPGGYDLPSSIEEEGGHKTGGWRQHKTGHEPRVAREHGRSH